MIEADEDGWVDGKRNSSINRRLSAFAPLFHIRVKESGIVPGFLNFYLESRGIIASHVVDGVCQ